MVKRSGIAAALLVIAAAQGARAQGPGAPPPPPSPERLEAAKDFFRQGNAELAAGRYDRALDLFLQSRAQVPSVANTNNAALALEKLERSDEAIDLYEELLASFAGRLSSEERASVSSKLAALQQQVGRLQVSANIDGTLIVDGRRRGVVPLGAPIRVPAGPHLVRVIRDGYAPAEATVTTTAGQLVTVDLKLEALAATGRLRVVDEGGASGLEVQIDGAPVGVTPWEGTLGPGRHIVALRGADVGSAPVAVNVLVGQTTTAPLRAEPLGPPLTLLAQPPTAQLSLDGVDVGRGPWRGRLPRGEHAFEVHEEGYETVTVRLGDARSEATVALVVDERHPRWRATGRWRLDAVLGFGVGSDLGSQAEKACDLECTERASGLMAGLRLSYRLPVGFSVEATAGVMQFGRDFRRQQRDGLTYDAADSLRLRGPFAALGVGYRRPLTPTVAAVARFDVGALFARATDPVEVSVTSAGRGDTPMVVDRSGEAARATTVFVLPAIGADIAVGNRLVLGLGLAAGVFLSDGPRLPHRDVTPATASCSSLDDPACARASSVFAGERAYSSFVTWMPQISLGRDFLASRRGTWRCRSDPAARRCPCSWRWAPWAPPRRSPPPPGSTSSPARRAPRRAASAPSSWRCPTAPRSSSAAAPPTSRRAPRSSGSSPARRRACCATSSR